MEILKITESKLKLMLNKHDMIQYGLDSESINYNDPDTRRKFFKILDSVKQTSGFDTDGDKLLIQCYPSRDGGCEVFVTKLGLLPGGAERAITKSDRITLLRQRRAIYRFLNFESLMAAIGVIKALSVKQSDIYYDDGAYYLDILERGLGRGGGISEYAALLEYAKSLPDSFYPYITEHCQKLSEGDGIQRLQNLLIPMSEGDG